METALDIAGRFIPESPRCGDLELAILRHMEHHVAKADNRWRDEIRRLRAVLEHIRDTAYSPKDDDCIWLDDRTNLGQYIDANLKP